jgi:hypothetical protein
VRLTQKILVAAAAAIAVAGSAGAAKAHVYNANAINGFAPASHHSYVGAWPVTITNSQFSNGTGCLTLSVNDAGGSATLILKGVKYTFGSFIVLNHILTATIQEPLGSQNGALMFIAPATSDHPGQGIYEDVAGGSNFDFGSLTFGAKNGC